MQWQAEFDWYLGRDYTASIFYLEPDGVTPINTTGCTAEMQIRQAQSGGLQATFSTGDGAIVFIPATGEIRFRKAQAQMVGWVAGIYDMAMYIQWPGGDNLPFLVDSKFVIHKRVLQ